jgi:hypothetical protein
MIVLVRKVVAWLGFDGRSTKSEWLHSAVEMLRPLIAGGLVASIDGIGGFSGWLLGILYAAVAWVLWWPLVNRWAPWRRRNNHQ